MSFGMWFDLGLACFVGAMIWLVTPIVKAQRAADRELDAYLRARGIDPGVQALRTIAELQAHQRPGWHPLDRLAIRGAIRTWRSLD